MRANFVKASRSAKNNTLNATRLAHLSIDGLTVVLFITGSSMKPMQKVTHTMTPQIAELVFRKTREDLLKKGYREMKL